MRSSSFRRRMSQAGRQFRRGRHRVARILARIEDSVEHWFRTRNYQALLRGSPAIIVAALVIGATVGQAGKPKAALADRYLWAARDALAAKNLEAAELYARKVLQLSDSDPEARFLLAQIAQQRGDRVEFDRLLAELAPDKSNGHPPAHLLQATRLLQAQGSLTKTQLPLVIHHLEVAASHVPLRAVANQTLGQLYYSQRDWDRALDCFEAITPERPEAHLWIANIVASRNDAARAKSELTRAVASLTERIRTQPNNTQSRLLLANAYRMLGNLAEAERVLREGFTQPDGDRCRAELAAFCVAKADQLAAASEAASLEVRLNLLQQALQCSPGHATALDRVAVLAGLTSNGARLDRDVLKGVLAAGRAATMAHLLLGVLAADAGDSASARIHLQQAAQLDPVTISTVIGLVRLSADRSPPETARALRLAEAAVDAWPVNTDVRSVRDSLKK